MRLQATDSITLHTLLTDGRQTDGHTKNALSDSIFCPCVAKLVVSRYVDVSSHLRSSPDDGVLDPDRLGQLHLELLPLPPQHDPPVVEPLRLVAHLNMRNE